LASADNALAEVIREATNLATAVGPGWGLAILVAILLFFPKYGVVIQLASLIKEDRADARKRRIEYERLATKYRNRPSVEGQKPEPQRRLGKSKEG